MDGATAVVGAAVAAGLGPCFANPGTTELGLVAALDAVAGARAVLGLAEGVCTGAADGYGRMADRPAWALLHLGPGFVNGAANLHNARRARTPLLTVVGDHPTWHRGTDAPLTTDLEGLARPVSDWVGATSSAAAAGTELGRAAWVAATGRVATLVVPADHAWDDSRWDTAAAADVTPVVLRRPRPPADAVRAAAAALRGARRPLLLLGGTACRADGLHAAAALAAATGAALLVETFPARWERGRGLPVLGKLGYFPEAAREQLAGHDAVVLAGARAPVGFFGYRGQPSVLTGNGTVLVGLAGQDDDAAAGLADLVAELGAAPVGPPADAPAPEGPTGALDVASLGAAVAAAQPEGAIVVDESNTSGKHWSAVSAGAAPHTVLALTGGAIGFGPPAATGAAIACPDRPVLDLQADGSGLYSLQALWTQAREQLDVTTVVCSNGSYRILRAEAGRAGTELGETAAALTDLTRPELDWVALARGFGVPGRRVESAEQLTGALRAAFSEPGPHLISVPL